MKIQIAELTNPGGRAINDDTVCCRESVNGAYVFVGDGLGGYKGGKQASETAGETLLRECEEKGMMTDDRFQETAAKAEEAVRKLQDRTGGNMKTTIVLLALEGEYARWMHVGDSRLYRFDNGKLTKQTRDHSVSQMAVLMGDITQEQIRFHEDRNLVLRALGGGNARADISEKTSITGGQASFLLCTDGFWEYVYETEMEALLKQAKNPAQWLAAMEKLLLQRATGEHDNYTAAAVFVR